MSFSSLCPGWAFSFLLLAGLGQLYAANDSQPNIVVIFTDDQGMHDVGCYGSEIKTPHIDSLARDGVKFTSWYSASSICTPSRYGLLTGRNPSRSQDRLLGALMFLADEDKTRGIQPGETTFASLLQQHGYRTALAGKWHLGHGDKKLLPTHHGFDSFYGHTGGCIDYFVMRYGIQPDWYRNLDYVDEVGYATDLITDEAVRFVKRHDPKRPYFLYVAYNAPHFGKGYDYQNSKVVNIMQPRADDMRRTEPTDDITRRMFAAMTMRLDDGVGEILSAIDASQQADNTLVVFITDHGGDPKYGGNNKPFRGDKATLYEGGIRVPCLMRWPGVLTAGKTVTQVCSSLDVFPTVCHLASIDTDKMDLNGVNLWPVITEGQTLEHRELFWQLGAHAELNRKGWTALRQGEWKYVQAPEMPDELFNVQKDPHEKTNLADEEPKRLERLKRRAAELAKQYAAPR